MNVPHKSAKPDQAADQQPGWFDLNQYLNYRQAPRARVVDAAARLFCDRGFQVVTMNDIAKAVGLSKAGLYHHCPSKDLILTDIVTLCGQILLLQLQGAKQEDASPFEQLKNFVLSRMEAIVEFQSLFTIVYQERPYLTNESIGDIAKSAETYRAGVRELIEQCQNSGQLDPDVDSHVLMFAIDGMTGWAYVWFRKEGTRTAAELGETFWNILTRGILAKPD